MRRSSQSSYAMIGLIVLVGLVAYVLWSSAGTGAPAAAPTASAAASTVTARPSPSPTPARLTFPTDAPTRAAAVRTATPAPRATPAPTSDASLIMRNMKIYALDGRLAYQGDVDLNPILDRIAAGVSDSHSNDGAVFGNFERRLPVQRDREYYREYVVRTPNLREVGPQRLILGKGGEAYYTPDHYDTFVRVR